MKKVWFQLHWVFGISAGLVLALMGLTGAMLSFQDEILRAANPASLTVEKRAGGTLPMGELIRRVEGAEPGKKVAFVWVKVDGDEAGRIFYTPKPGQRRGEARYVDPYTAQLLPAPRGEGLFNFIMQLHRFLAAGEAGKQVTAACTLILLYLCLSGLYLRWPRKALNWRAWLAFDWRKKGRAFNWDLHAVAGTWCLAFYLLAALTGLYWSYDWYRGGLFKLLDDTPAGQHKGLRGGGKRGPAPEGPPPVLDADAVWATIQQTGGASMTAYNLRMPPVKGQPATVFYLLDDAAHDRAFNEMTIDPVSGELLGDKRYNDSSFGKQLLTSVYALHVGSYFGLTGRILMMLASLSMPLFFVTGWLLYLDRRRKKRAAVVARGDLRNTGGADAWLVGYASQSGFAERLAWQSAGQLQAAGLPVRVEPLAKLDRAQLQQTRNALFVVSTFGDGEAPDSARGFERQVLGQALGLHDLRFAVLALGDRQYEQFCGFARRLQGWLQGQGARPLFEGIDVDNGDAAALHDWQQQLARLSGSAPQAAFSAPAFEVWSLVGREHLNPGSQGESTWLLRLAAPSDSQIDWSAGDLVEIAPRQPEFLVEAWLDRLGLDGDASVQADGIATPLRIALAGCLLPGNLEHLVGQHAQAVYDALIKLSVRQYSIASLRSDGALELIVRQEQHADGSLGICSGWLTEYLPDGGSLLLRLRRNRSFHLSADDRPLILIGNGTGLAGLRSLLRASIAEGRRRNWLLFGERNIAHDFYCREELEGALARGELQRLDVAFSRDQAEKVYVQDRLRASGEVLAQWLEDGAVIHVCGSLQGMAEGVDRTLRELLGDAEVEALLESGRYRRDVY
ncbi:sulfite reductase flavoprotein subunit alpha [Pseudomonas sp. ZM23]|uniref:Sulfite reductase flavoprotein subunit alpha n=1 Tax=Pseudomonas triclosanedens TaxID=2961893 RepID=A0ABY7A5U4_9PSED|nr:sulfite reductase flavoprotein subunit alpha [Pseudomonas triclosanedens]MCP8463805.1 sulfite reductase flavoprotein subunit alpha [Pseudomonas triclosanedens]MCP8475611.1 sulfite reductase flavoprotein subunit alpha [Pseudomonas triclosanedens]WAI52424.1 sulfite reductase flavoprotein subunit alpha [Pseudomonas triclosanedens]